MARGLRIPALCALCGLLLLGTGAAAGAEDVQVRSVAGVATTSTIPPKVKQECNIQKDLPAAVVANAPNARLVPGKPKSGLYLDLVFTDVHAPGGGMFSGPKWLEARGTLQRGEKKLRSFRAKRHFERTLLRHLRHAGKGDECHGPGYRRLAGGRERGLAARRRAVGSTLRRPEVPGRRSALVITGSRNWRRAPRTVRPGAREQL